MWHVKTLQFRNLHRIYLPINFSTDESPSLLLWKNMTELETLPKIFTAQLLNCEFLRRNWARWTLLVTLIFYWSAELFSLDLFEEKSWFTSLQKRPTRQIDENLTFGFIILGKFEGNPSSQFHLQAFPSVAYSNFGHVRLSAGEFQANQFNQFPLQAFPSSMTTFSRRCACKKSVKILLLSALLLPWGTRLNFFVFSF